MPRRYFNWKLAIVVVLGLVVFGAAALTLHRWQRSQSAERRLEIGNQAYSDRKWEKAAENFGAYIAVVRDDISVLIKYARALLNIRPIKGNNIQQAKSAYREVLRINRDNSEVATQLTQIYEVATQLTQIYLALLDEPGEAELIAKRALGRDGFSPEVLREQPQTGQNMELRRLLAIAMAKQHNRQGKLSEAVVELNDIISESPGYIPAYETLGQLSNNHPSELGHPPLHWFDEAVKNNPSSALAYIIRAGFYLRGKDETKAVGDLEQAEKLDLSDSTVRLRLVRELMNAHLLDKAREHLVVLKDVNPSEDGLWQTWGMLAQQSRSEEEMVTVAESGLELSNQPLDFMPIATELLIRADNYERAEHCIEQLQREGIAPATTEFLKGLLAYQRAQYHQAAQCWKISIEYGKKSPEIRLALASVLSRLGDTNSALRQLHTLVSERPDNPKSRMALAELLGRAGKWAEAAEQAREATRLAPEALEPQLLYLQARIQLLSEDSANKSDQRWQGISDELNKLERTTNGAFGVKLLKLQLASLQGNFEDANALITGLRILHPSHMKLALTEAQLLVAQGKIDDAISLLSGMTEKFPLAVEPVMYLAHLLVEQDDKEKCEKILKDALAHIEQPAAKRELGLLLARFYIRWDQKDDAFELLGSLAQELPKDVPIKRGLLKCDQVMPEEAQKLVDEIKSLEGEDTWQWRYEQARLWFRHDFQVHSAQILSLLQENLNLNPDDQASRLLRAAAHETAGNLSLAILDYEEALSRTPTDIRIVVASVAAMYKAGRYDRAYEILDSATTQGLRHPRLKRLELEKHLRDGEIGSASTILEDLLADRPDNRLDQLALALLKIEQKDFIEAQQQLDRLRTEEPNSLTIAAVQIKLFIRQGQTDQALLLCNELVDKIASAPAYILRGRTYATLGDSNEASEDFERATAVEPGNVYAWAAKSDFYRSIGRFNEAISSIRQAMSLEPNSLSIRRRAVLLLLASTDPNRVREGNSILDKALELYPRDVELRLYRARSLIAVGNTKDAALILHEITDEHPEVSNAWLLLGEICLNQEKSGEAIDFALRGLHYNPKHRQLLLLKARAEQKLSPLSAIATLKILRELYPNDFEVVKLLANAYIEAGEAEKAVNLLRKQLSVCDAATRRECRTELAVALYKNNNKEEAEREFDSLYQSAPNDPGPLIAEIKLLAEDKRWSQLREKVTDWTQAHPKDAEVPFAAATIILQTTGHSAQAVDFYQQVIKLDPNNLIALNNLAWILCEEQGKPKQALELAQRGLEKAPEYTDLIDTRGAIWHRLGEFEKAASDFERCIASYPAGRPALTASYFHLGRTQARLGKKREALKNLKKALELNTETGGLSTADVDETQRLIKELSEER
ncbi:MAG: tetratricopeptide repeat protein [Planctomycetota bacterium]|jgi:tetratricopeptide (TPR) repeat protein